MSDDLIWGLLEEMKQERVGELPAKSGKGPQNTSGSKKPEKKKEPRKTVKKNFFGDTRLWDDEHEMDEDEEEELVTCSQAKQGRHKYVFDPDDLAVWSNMLMLEALRWKAMSGLANKFKEMAGDVCKRVVCSCVCVSVCECECECDCE
jgi:hypothetical protein